ncbi:uncharacterized protein GGS22DRAFT_179625 [Annulohypoxylon maeteangense]|uniref:uncharacterized protein n=1 Tax=Annulohypoxylon maeteangense TaxID=1927788 RepID=UPI0020082A71|nr:uncharacterized protein GGS22DRAFT_179625 [Annulohypoxylon maeteangense]KAI0884985.1 hypothetical protein GGS22DRAFT_179625 [Annulohypoxylon maeteangense]
MSFFCCCRGRRTTTDYREPDREIQEILDFPIHPPRARLSKSLFPAPELDLSSPHIAVTKAPSLLHSSIPEVTVDPTILEVDDSDDDEPVRSIRNSSTGTLEAIKTRFIRPLSQKSESKRHSQQYLGASEEEIARRAELKRLMHKRIQEELKSEEQEEADSKATNPDESKPGSSANVGLLGGGPRDNIEFSFSDVNEINSKDSALESADAVPLELPESKSQPQIFLRRSSYPGSPSRSHDSFVPRSHGNLKEQGSLPQFPSSPQLAPVHLPSARGSESLCSWRLSYSAEQLANYLGPPEDPRPDEESEPAKSIDEMEGVDKDGDDHEDNIARCPSISQTPAESLEPIDSTQQKEPTKSYERHDQSEIRNPESPRTESSNHEGSGQDSPLDMWLRSQELQSTSTLSSRRTSGMISQMALDNFNPGNSDSPQKSIKDPQNVFNNLSASPPNATALPCGTHVNTNSAELPPSWPDVLRRPSEGCTSSPGDNIPGSVDHVRDVSSSHYASSRYTTRPNSCQATEKESRLSLIELLGGRKAIQPFTNFNRLIYPSGKTDAEKSDDSSYKTAPNAASALDITMHETQQLGRPTADSSSLAVSDTASFKQREAELKSVEQRFTQVHLRRDNAASPIISKFREEFNEPRTSLLSRNSIFAKFHLSRPKKAKHPTKDIWRYSQKPEDVVSIVNLRQRNSICDEDTPDNQQQGHSSQVQKSLEITHSDQEGQHGIPSVPSPKTRLEQLKPPCRHEDDNSPQSDISNNVLREWVNLMNDEDIESQLETKEELQNRSPKRLRTPPASWAKWPSHTRHERTGPAGKDDNVIQRDFAVQVGSNTGDITWSTGKPGEPSKRYITPGSRSLSAQLGKAVKEGLEKVVQRNSSETHRGRRKPDGHLEYPELEILPMQGGYEELQALEQQIGTMKRKSVPVERQLARLSSDNMRLPLSVRLAEEVHMMQHKASRDSDSWHDEDLMVQTSPEVSSKPARQLLLPPQGASEGIDQFETSESQISYEDCVPKHMLEDEGPVDSIVMAMEEGRNTQAT